MVPKAVPILSLRRYGFRAKADHGARCSEWPWRAHTGSVKFARRVLEARKMRQVHKHLRCLATGKPALHTKRSETIPAGSHVAVVLVVRCNCTNLAFEPQ